MIVHGFPNKHLALRFEWDWTHPSKSHYLREHLMEKQLNSLCKSVRLVHKIRIVYELLSLEPWCSLPLTLQWMSLRHQQAKWVQESPHPPSNIQICKQPLSEEVLVSMVKKY